MSSTILAAYPLADKIFRNASADELRSAASMVWWGVTWGDIGRPTFVLSHGLAASLLLTDCSGVGVSEVQMPFDAFALKLPHPDPFLVFDGLNGTRDVADTVRVGLWLQPLTGADYTDLVEQTEEDGHMMCRVRPDISLVPVLWVSAQGATCDLQRELPITEDTDAEGLLGVKRGAVDNWFGVHPRTPQDIACSKAMSRLVVNFCLYLSDLRVRGEWSPASASVNVKRKPKNRDRVWRLRAIKLQPEVIKMAHENGSGDPKWKLEARFVVRGHWRNQACGPASSERRRQWIRPHWKGPKEGERLARLYEVKEG